MIDEAGVELEGCCRDEGDDGDGECSEDSFRDDDGDMDGFCVFITKLFAMVPLPHVALSCVVVEELILKLSGA